MARLLKLADRMKFLLPGLPSSGSRLMHCMPAEATVPLSPSFSPSFVTDAAAAAASAGEMLYAGAAGAAGFRASFVGSMELMAVPKRKVTPSRKGKRNGPKFLKPVPVVAKCTSLPSCDAMSNLLVGAAEFVDVLNCRSSTVVMGM